ncbi:MAG: hypothetical protein J3K34DRAFT_138449 [Monoraphidium minutum]|nr:MAG: hypothetical protein J3K34DRAFT_138449 [Monoraphidium minutum]
MCRRGARRGGAAQEALRWAPSGRGGGGRAGYGWQQTRQLRCPGGHFSRRRKGEWGMTARRRFAKSGLRRPQWADGVGGLRGRHCARVRAAGEARALLAPRAGLLRGTPGRAKLGGGRGGGGGIPRLVPPSPKRQGWLSDDRRRAPPQVSKATAPRAAGCARARRKNGAAAWVGGAQLQPRAALGRAERRWARCAGRRGSGRRGRARVGCAH